MIVDKGYKKAEMIKCSLCGHSFEEGLKSSCESCPLNYGSCNFEKCPNCGYDIPQGSFIGAFAAKMAGKIKRWRKDDKGS